MQSIKQIPLVIEEGLDAMINLAWEIFINHYINGKYEINLEAPFLSISIFLFSGFTIGLIA
jgi:hypothetical protein